MKKRMISLLCFVVCLSLIFPSAIPVFAIDITGEDQFLGQYVSVLKGEFGTYFVEETDEHTLAVGIVDGMIDFSICYASAPQTAYSSILPVPDELLSCTASEVFISIRKAVLGGMLPMQITTVEYESLTGATVPMAVSEEDRELLLQHVYLQGYPVAYSNSIILLGIREGVYYQVVKSLSYGVAESGIIGLLAGYTVSIVLALTGISDESTALEILSFAKDVATGVYELLTNCQVRRYDVSAYYARQVKLEGSVYCTAQKTVRWKGFVGNRSGGIEYQYETQHWPYDDPNELVNIALSNYSG